MVQHTRNSAGAGVSNASQPITRHPLFPAIVALWFGALFGLGSLALRPALVEHLVVASGIDTIVPMAAPPLGTTMRILVALALTGIGGIIGFVIARRLAAPATTPAAAPTAATPLAGRRRSLASPDTQAAVVDAPAKAILDPVILDVADLDPDGLDGPAPAPVAAPARMRETASGTFVTPTARAQEAHAELAAAIVPEYVASEPATTEAVTTEEGAPLGQSLFDSYARDLPARADPGTAIETVSAAEPEPGFTLLGTVEEPVEEPIAGEPAASEATADAPFNALIADDDGAPAPIDATPELAPATALVGAPISGPVSGPFSAAVPETRLAASRLVNAPLDELSPVELLERLALAMARRREDDARLAAAELEAAAAAKAEAAAEAERAAHEAAAAEAVAVAPLAIEVAAIEPLSIAPVDDADIAEAGTAKAETAEMASFVPPAPVRFERLSLRAIQFEAPAQPVALVEPAAADIAAAPYADQEPGTAVADLADDEPVESGPDIASAPGIAEPAPFAVPRVPAALRPVAHFAVEDEDDDHALPGYIPPRHIGGAAPFASPASGFLTDADVGDAPEPVGEMPNVPQPDDGHDADADEDDHSLYALDEPDLEPDAEDEDDTLDTGYSSLLSLSRPAAARQSFIRIDEPEHSGEIPPMVVFPGNEPDAAPAAEPGHGLSSVPGTGPRLFDGPARTDADGTERALRAALATLQRMSGAA